VADWNPELYNRFRRYREEPVLMMLDRLAPRAEDRIIDLGCGSGENTIELAKRSAGGFALGTDSSPAMIDRAEALRAKLELPLRDRVAFRLEDINDFHADRDYTVVFSNATLHWVPDHRAVFRSIFAALKPGGRVAIQMPANYDETAQVELLRLASEEPWRDALKSVDVPSHSVMEPEQYRKMLPELGFISVECFYYIFKHPMDDPGEVVAWMLPTTMRPFMDALAEDRHREFIDALGERLCEAYGTRAKLIFPFRRLFVFCSRPPMA